MADKYEMTWRNKWLTADVTSITHMADLLAEAAEELRAMAAAGITLDADGGVADDYASLVTSDAAIAARFGLESIEEDATTGLDGATAAAAEQGEVQEEQCDLYEKMERQYAKVGVDIYACEWAVDGEPVATGFRCQTCGCAFSPDAKRSRNRHRCPNNCNADLTL